MQQKATRLLPAASLFVASCQLIFCLQLDSRKENLAFLQVTQLTHLLRVTPGNISHVSSCNRVQFFSSVNLLHGENSLKQLMAGNFFEKFHRVPNTQPLLEK